ncbi:MAG TPA: SDR family NAD(P)-dependent oxidoreductase [Pyrinomonadaceae bacterium]|nr:SDR family NAD(P)-dependent oxidoreductase [Pyrinomonadaceae bacterium]
MLIDWAQQVVLITGASSGIGRALAVELAQRGAAVGLLARRLETLQEIVREIEATGGRAFALPADVTNADEVRAAAESLRARFGQIDMLIANAGVGGRIGSAEFDAQDVADVLQINVVGAANSVAAVLPEMRERGRGQLVAISSLAAYRGVPKSAPYCASKAALTAMFESLRLDLTGTGVDVSIIYPGFIKTPLTTGRHARMPYLMELDDAIQKIVRAIEQRRKSYAFPWQLASLVRLGLVMPVSLYDRIALRNSFRE